MSKARLAMSSEEMVQLLVLDSIEHSGDFKRYLWLQNALERGFVGYAAMSCQELMREMRWRGLSIDAKADEDECDIDDDLLEVRSWLLDWRTDSIVFD